MSDESNQFATEMAEAERRLREAENAGSPGAVMMAISHLYFDASEYERDALVSVLIARVAIQTRPRSAEVA